MESGGYLGYIIMAILLGIIAIVVLYFLARWVYSIDRQIKHEMDILYMIADKLDISKETLDDLKKDE